MTPDQAEGKKDLNLLRPYWLPIFTLVTVVALSLLFLKPKLDEIARLRQNIRQEKAKLSALSQKVTALEGLSLPQIKERVDIAFKVLPVKGNVPLSMATIRALATATGNELSSLEANPETSPVDQAEAEKLKDFSLYNLKVSLTGSDEAIRTFLQKIISVTPLTQTVSLDFTSERLKGLGSADIGILTFSLPLPESLGKIEDPVPVITSGEEALFQKISQLASPLQPVGPIEIAPVPSGKENLFGF
jgi:Tfp pilus assembly protein PilO